MAYYIAGEILRLQRSALKLPREEFLETDPVQTTTMTIYRIERLGTAPTERTYRHMTGRMGSESSLRQGVLKTDEFSTLLCRNEISRALMHRDCAQAEQLHARLERQLDPSEPRNGQYLLWLKAVLQYMKGEIDAEGYEKRVREALRITIPEFDRISIADWPFRVQEWELLHHLNAALRSQKKYTEQLDLLNGMMASLELGYMDSHSRTLQETFVLAQLGDVLGTLGRHEEALEMDERAIRLCRQEENIARLAATLYDKHWNLWMLGKIQPLTAEQQEAAVQSILQACCLCEAIGKPADIYRKRLRERYPEAASLIDIH